MRFSRATALAACLSAATSFKDTSPYLLFSNSGSPSILDQSSRQLQSAADVLKTTKEFLSGCPSDIYIIVLQPDLNVADFNSKALPRLRKTISSDSVKTKISVSEVIGELSPSILQDYITSHCDAVVVNAGQFNTMAPSGDNRSLKPTVIHQYFPPLPKARFEREIVWGDHDALLQMFLNDALRGKKYTVIYTTTPVSGEIFYEFKTYEPAFMEPLHMELKRQSDFNNTASNSTALVNAPLFEKYQFFTPGIFMGLLVSLLLLSILSVAINAVSSVKVSYGAFDKEMGSAAQKKLQ